MTDILEVLRKMRLPALLIELMMLIYRFIFLLLETASAIMTAQESRLGKPGLQNKSPLIRSNGVCTLCSVDEALRRAL